MHDSMHAQQGSVPVDSGAQEHEVRPEHRFDGGQGDRSCLIDDQQLCLCQLSMVLRLDVLERLHTGGHRIRPHAPKQKGERGGSVNVFG